MNLLNLLFYMDIFDIVKGNLALGKPTWQATGSSDGNNHPSNVVDGCHWTYWSSGCCTVSGPTAVGTPNWWAVDLQQPVWMTSFAITNRDSASALGPHVPKRLTNFTVSGSMTSHDPSIATDMSRCYHKTDMVGDGATESYECDQAIRTRYVIVWKNPDATIHVDERAHSICEMEVFGVYDMHSKYPLTEENKMAAWDGDEGTCLSDSTMLSANPLTFLLSADPRDGVTAVNVTVTGENLQCPAGGLLHVAVGGASDDSYGRYRVCHQDDSSEVTASSCSYVCQCSGDMCHEVIIHSYDPRLQLCDVTFRSNNLT